MQKVSDLKEPPIVGQFYLVRCTQLPGDRWMPIVGTWHRDSDIGVPYFHYHLDVRFIPDAGLQPHRGYPADVATLGAIVRIDRSSGWHIPNPNAWQWRRRKCRRLMPEMPDIMSRKGGHDHYQPFIGRKVLCGKCPHKGMPLESLPQDENGHVICNGHGLRIDMNKREVIER